MMSRIFFQFLVILLSFNITIGQSIDATLLELKFSNDGYPEKFTKVENGFFFTSEDDQLWFSDGTAEKTDLVRDFNSGLYNDIEYLTPLGEKVFFVAENGSDNRELWVSDGTEEGTVQLTDRNVNSGTEGIYDVIEYNGKIYFGAYSEGYGNELWISDGTPSGTLVFKDISANSADSYPRDFFVFDGKLFFKADSEGYGTELWTSDGTEEGTVLLKDIRTGNFGSIMTATNQDYIIYEENFYFFANNGTTGSELWKSDGTPEGTQLVKDINVGSNNSSNNIIGAVVNNKLIFVANDGIHGNELWSTDGTTGGTQLFKDINSGTGFGFEFDGILQQIGNKIFFTASDGAEQSGLWVSDGTNAGTVFVSFTKPNYLIGANTEGSYAVFFAQNENNKNVLWKSDGTSNGTVVLSEDVQVTNISVSDQGYLPYENRIFFNGKNKDNGNEMWVTDGTPEGTKLFFDVNHSYGVSPSLLTAVGNKLFFRGNEDGYFGLCTSDGTPEGTKHLYINSDGQSIDEESEFINFNGKLVVSANDGVHGYELWISDGTQEGTFMVKDINPGNASGMLNSVYNRTFLVFNNKLYFHANDGSGRGIWVTDGTSDGTYKLTSPGITALAGPNGYTAFTGFGNDIYFYGTNGSSKGVYKINGSTNENTFIRSFGSIEHMAVANNKLFIIQDNLLNTYPEAAWELWASDGTFEGTSFLMDFADDRIDHILTFKDELYFAARIKLDPGGSALFKSDGTIEGTIPIFTGKIPTLSYPQFKNLVVCGDYLYFGIEDDSDSIIELWNTDGTIEGTKAVISDIGSFNSINELTCFKDNLFFKEYSSPNKIGLITGQPGEVYHFDITSSNTKGELLYFYNLTIAEDKLYFYGSTEAHGPEIYVTSVLNISSDGELTDTDADGVVDLFDECPDTPVGETVNEDGCSESQLDDDNDGITNNLDQCPDTLPGETVDVYGCSESDLDDSDGDGVNNTADTCPDTPQGEIVNSNGCSDSQLDDDNDGVMNNIDLCPDSVGLVNENGCFELPSDNFTIETIGETCSEKNNGQIKITANQSQGYVTTINDVVYTFTDQLAIDNLSPGSYDFCIGVEDEIFEQCYTVEIAEGAQISGKIDTSGSKSEIEILDGTPPFEVSVNGKHRLTTTSGYIELDVNDGDIIQVSSSKTCEGTLEKVVSLSNSLVVFPNPTQGEFEIILPDVIENKVVIEIYSTHAKLISSKNYTVVNKKVYVDLTNKPSGLYLIKVLTNKPVELKIIKQ